MIIHLIMEFIKKMLVSFTHAYTYILTNTGLARYLYFSLLVENIVYHLQALFWTTIS